MNHDPAKVALFWDQSFLWGLIAYRSFRRLGLNFELISSKDIRVGRLDGFDMVFVPGGWASDKMDSLGDEGAEAIRRFVDTGGSYMGFCGGAGLALSHESGLGLAPFGRMPADVRLPSFSGKIGLSRAEPKHPMWREVDDGAAFHAWWPGQFAPDSLDEVKVLAAYGEPGPGSFVTDLPVGPDFDWKLWEEAYGINLNPDRIVGEPAVIEIGYGRGKAILSYLHFETPWDKDGNRVLLNLIEHLSGDKSARFAGFEAGIETPHAVEIFPDERGRVAGMCPVASIACDIERMAWDFIEFGKQNFLWYWRSSWLLQWRRGVKGIEYSALYGMLAELDRLTRKFDPVPGDEYREKIMELGDMVDTFLGDARKLIIRERFAMTQGPVSPLKSSDPEINELRERLFSSSKRCGGLYEEIMEKTESVLLPLLIRENQAK